MEAELVQLLGRIFPSFRGIAPNEALRRAESLGLFAAQAWQAGPEGLAARGIPVPAPVHARLAPVAPRVVQAQRGGATFLAHVRQGVGDDAAFARTMAGLAQVYAQVTRGQAAPAPPPAPPPQAPPAAPPGGGDMDLVPMGRRQTSGGMPVPSLDEPAGGGLDLAPEPPPRPSAYDPGGLDLAPEPAPRPEPEEFGVDTFGPGDLELAPPPEPKRKPRGKIVRRMSESQEALDLAPEDDDGGRRSAMADLFAGVDDDGEAEEKAPEDPAARAVWNYERTGDPKFLQEAGHILQGEVQNAPHNTAAAFAKANLGRVALLLGRREAAERLAQEATSRDPSNPVAVEVTVRASRGEAAEAAFDQVQLQLNYALEERDVGDIQRLAGAMAQRYPQEPFPYLAMLFVAHMQREAAAFQKHLRAAWARYPSQAYAHKAFGGAVDADIASALMQFGRQPLKTMDPDELDKTVQDIDSKDNLIAGSLRMAVGVARVAAAQGGQTRTVLRRLYFAAGQALVGLQYYDAAPGFFSKALMLGPSAEESKAISNERLKAQALRRAFDKPGIKAQLKTYKCPGTHGMVELLRGRLEAVRSDRAARDEQTVTKGKEVAVKAQADAKVRREIAEAASFNDVDDPMASLEAIEAELAQIARDRQAGPAKPQAKGGLFGKLKAAASSVGNVAKDAALKLKESQLKSRREEAGKRMAVQLSRELSDFEWRHPVMVRFAREARVNEAFLDYLKAEEARLKNALKQLADTV